MLQKQVEIIFIHILYLKCLNVFRETIALLATEMYAFCNVVT
jgi:hypothetical protein